MKQLLRICVLALCVGAGLTFVAESEAHAAPGFGIAPLMMSGSAAPSMFGVAAVPAWQTPFSELTKLSLSSDFGGLGVLQQNFVAGVLVPFIVLYSIAAIAAIVALIGNIIAFRTGRGRFPWGIVGISCGAAAILLTSIFSFGTVEGLLLFLPVAGVAVTAIVFGIINLIGGIRERRRGYRGGRRRYYRRRYYRRRRPRYEDGPPGGTLRPTGGFRAQQMFNVASAPMVSLNF